MLSNTGRDLVNISEAARRSEIPRTTIVAWIGQQRLFPIGLDSSGNKLYDLAAVRDLGLATRRRRRGNAPR